MWEFQCQAACHNICNGTSLSLWQFSFRGGQGQDLHWDKLITRVSKRYQQLVCDIILAPTKEDLFWIKWSFFQGLLFFSCINWHSYLKCIWGTSSSHKYVHSISWRNFTCLWSCVVMSKEFLFFEFVFAETCYMLVWTAL